MSPENPEEPKLTIVESHGPFVPKRMGHSLLDNSKYTEPKVITVKATDSPKSQLPTEQSKES
jgi:hypothetical protein